MSLYLVAYDLNKAGQNYESLRQKLEAFPSHWHIQQSVWLVVWSGNSLDLANDLEGCLDDNDDLIVTKVTHDTAWSGFDADGSAWLGQNI